jgi:glycosyltransferase involved in cell wall biosynthesis
MVFQLGLLKKMNNIKSIRILHVFFSGSTSGYKPGWDRFDTITELLREKGFDVWVLGYAQNWSNLKRKILGSIDIDLKNKIINITQPRWLSTLEYYSTYNLVFIMGIGYAVLLYKVCKNLKINTVILADDIIGINFYFLLMKKIFRMKINTIINYEDLNARMHTFKSKNILMKIVSTIIDEVINPKLAKKIITITNFGKEFLFHRSKINKGFVIPYLFRPENQIEENHNKNEIRRKLGLNPQSIIFIWSGHLGGFTTDDVLFLIRALSLSKNKSKILLLLTGSATDRDKIIINSFAKKVGVNVKHVGYVDKKLYWQYLMAADIGVFIRSRTLFSHFLSGTKVADYMRIGLPVIVPCLKGQLEVIKGNGLCYKPEDVKDLAMKIDKILEMDLQYMGYISRKIIENNLKYVTQLIAQKDFLDFLMNY